MIEGAIRTRLLDEAMITRWIGSGTQARLWPMKMPQRETPSWPCITYQVISGSTEYDIQGAAGLAEMRLQVDVWSAARAGVRAYDEVRELAEAVRRSLSGFAGAIDGTGYAVQSCFLDQRRTGYEDAAQVYRETMDWSIAFAE